MIKLKQDEEYRSDLLNLNVQCLGDLECEECGEQVALSYEEGEKTA